MQRFGVQHKLTAFGLGGRGSHRHLAAELLRRSGLAFANAFDLRRMQSIDLGTALPVILKAHPMGERQRLGKAFLERLIARDLAPDVAVQLASA